ncbi:hypothetical protein HNQ96_006364 [Aminobacter lissarensis]|uniref:Uncharacterized protein n=1 Tax=Aminobacter carboxidus TaxID=376165 RepID=A0A8E2BF53_9HYPH|nr:hypothetical protein [Aminobacter lissarensis]
MSCLNTATRIPTVSFPHSLYTKLNTQDSRHSSLAHEVENDGCSGASPQISNVCG